MLSSKDSAVLPAMQLPSFRTSHALDRGVEKRLLFKLQGGIGDIICAEPTLRYVLEEYGRECHISLATQLPELFQHLRFAKVYDLKKETFDPEKYYVFDTVQPSTELIWEFLSHMNVNCIDYHTLATLRSTLPNNRKRVRLEPSIHDARALSTILDPILIKHAHPILNKTYWVAVHPGKHWPSKTFPKDWWDTVLSLLKAQTILPVLIGDDCDDNRGTVDVDANGCLDLRGRLSLMQSVALVQRAPVVITNDSSPLHMAASGVAWIGYVATCKHPDYLTHWRGQLCGFGWRMENLGLGGFWDHVGMLPNKREEVVLDAVDPDLLRSWLPDPRDVAAWVSEKLTGIF